MTPPPAARSAPPKRLIGFALVGAFLFGLLAFRFSVFVWLSAAFVVLGVQFLLVIGRAWALEHRHLTLARWLAFDRWTRDWFDFQIAVQDGRIEEAERLYARFPSTAFGDAYGWNQFINALITLGRYRKAVTTRKRFGKSLREARQQHREHYGLALLNIAEALYNLGRWRRAKQLMLALEARGFLKDPLNRAGGLAQLAWIEAHDGNPAAALALLASVDVRALPYDYHSELHFTFAAAHLANGDSASARASLANARDALVRRSSERNLLFMEARCARAEGKLGEAARLCERAAKHPYRGQGGDGLLLWGDVCEQLGDMSAAQRAWQLAIERDRESESAQLAERRLGRQLEKIA